MEIKTLKSLDDIYPLTIPSAIYAYCNIEYQKYYMDGWSFEDLSFGIFEKEQCLAFVLLTKGISSDGKLTFDWYGLASVSVESANLPKEARTLLNNRIKTIFSGTKPHTCNYIEYILPEGLTRMATNLLEQGCMCKPIFKANIDLKFDERILWKNIRSSYKSLINKAFKNIKYELITFQNVSLELFNAFCKFHISVAQRITRNKDSWHEQFLQVKNNKAFCIVAYDEHEQLISASFYIKEHKKCIYGTGVYDRDKFALLPIAHGAMWKAILHAKTCGCDSFEIGETFFPYQMQSVTEKEYSIGFFKRGLTKTINTSLRLYQ